MKVKNTPLSAAMKVPADRGPLISRAGMALLVGVVDRVGLTGALVESLSDLRERRGLISWRWEHTATQLAWSPT